MTDEEVTAAENIPEPPAPPAPPEETPQEPSVAPEEEPEQDEIGEGSEDPTEPTEPAEGAEEPPAQPQVVNDASGQHVLMPDGTVVTTRTHSFPVGNAEQEQYDLTHHGDQLRYPYVPGDAAYSPYSDPAVPDSHIARRVEAEIGNFGERVLVDPEAKVSPMWEGLKVSSDAAIRSAIATGVESGKVELS